MMLRKSSFVLILILWFEDSCPCPGKWTQTTNSLCLSFHSSQKSWQDAQNECKSNHGHLAMAKTDRDHADIVRFRLSQAQQADPAWLGIHANGAKWTWTDGTQVTWAVWANNYPPSTGTCGILDTAGNVQTWSSMPCEISLVFICQFTAAKSIAGSTPAVAKRWWKVSVDRRYAEANTTAVARAWSLLDCVRQCQACGTCAAVSFLQQPNVMCQHVVANTDVMQLVDAPGWEVWAQN